MLKITAYIASGFIKTTAQKTIFNNSETHEDWITARRYLNMTLKTDEEGFYRK